MDMMTKQQVVDMITCPIDDRRKAKLREQLGEDQISEAATVAEADLTGALESFLESLKTWEAAVVDAAKTIGVSSYADVTLECLKKHRPDLLKTFRLEEVIRNITEPKAAVQATQ
ncbi:MAG: hypothetical protein IMZ62_16550 [Chloroflexi bacterium]|nr:hypothetical protein [Chloroflexota bacterium]